jgi:hypothetical protein
MLRLMQKDMAVAIGTAINIKDIERSRKTDNPIATELGSLRTGNWKGE